MERSGSYNRKPIPRSILIFAAAGSLPGSFGLWLADASGPFWGWQTVYGWFQELARRFLFQMIRDIELTLDRERQGREASPSAALMRARRRLDASGTLPWNTDGRRLMVDLTTADISGSAGQAILDGIRKRWPRVKHLFADGAYHRLKLMEKASDLDFVTDVIRRSDQQKGFKVLPRRWGVERTFG